jgi:hypothetical protein
MPENQSSGPPGGGADAWPESSDFPEATKPDAPPEIPVYISKPDYGAEDYLLLPDFGVNYYSLEDAALLSALDMWSAGRAPGVPAEGLPMADGDDEAHDHQDDPLIRAALDPLRAQLLAALVRSAEAGQLDVEIRARTMADSRLIPARTFVLLPDLVEWLQVHGHDRADIIADIQESAQDEPWLIADAVAADRASLRLGHLESRHPAGTPGANAEGLRAELRQQRLHIAHLEKQLADARRGGRPADKPLSTRERRTLLVLVAALCKRAGIDPAARGASIAIASATAELGVTVSDDTIRPLLRLIPDAIG